MVSESSFGNAAVNVAANDTNRLRTAILNDGANTARSFIDQKKKLLIEINELLVSKNFTDNFRYYNSILFCLNLLVSTQFITKTLFAFIHLSVLMDRYISIMLSETLNASRA